MQVRFCPTCGCPLGREIPRSQAAVCPECGARTDPRSSASVGGLLVRGERVLLVRRRPTAATGPGLYCLPGRVVHWGEDAREAVVRAFSEQAGLEVEVEAAYDVHSSLHDPDDPTVGTWFRVRPVNAAEPVAGGDVDLAGWFALDQLPALAFPTEGLVLERLAHELGSDDGAASTGEAQRSDLVARLAARRQKYRDLLEAYTNELMRGAWVNELHLRLSSESSPTAIGGLAAEHLAGRREVEQVKVWYPGPPDRCDTCPWSDRCPRDQCLHLVASARGAPLDEAPQGAAPAGPREQRVPLLRGTPAADVALKNAPGQAELPGAGAQPLRFDGFPLDVGDPTPGVLGLMSRTPLDANARRLFEVVARHVGALVRNARLVEDLQAANNVKRSFIARLSHELKTPLTAILGFAELLREELVAADQPHLADGAVTIEQSGRKLLDMVESILEIAKLESGAVNLDFERVNLVEVAQERLALLQPRAADKGLRTAFSAPEDGAVTVWADRRRVRQVLDQLLSNAVKFTSAGEVGLTVLLGDEDVTCEVRDSGIGIGAEHLRSVFDAFHQISEAIHIEYGGLGIGLAMAKVLVERMGGRIWVESHPGQGSRFFFTLPRSATPGQRPSSGPHRAPEA
ncbi:MAG: NUDIX domain-containing protein [Planctomycetes bacterium]|nr:NUDIX domain-containing protein [Planctomycetota bacterium]